MKQILVLMLIAAVAKSDCLSNTVLTSLGFGDTQAVQKNDSATLCTNLFKDVGSCVPDASVKAKIEADNASFSASVSNIGRIYDSLASITEFLTDLADNKDSPSDSQIESVFDAARDMCVSSYSTVQQGITCYLASGDASTHTTVDGSTVTVNVDSATVAPLLYNCLPLVSIACQYHAAVVISSDNSVGTKANASDVTINNDYIAPCNTIKEKYSCKDTDDSCKQAIGEAIVDYFFAPYSYDLFPNESDSKLISRDFKTVLSGLKKNKDQLEAAIKAGGSISTDTAVSTDTSTNSRRLADNSNVKTKSASDGTDAKANGENSGVDKVETAHTYLVSVAVAFIIAALF